MALNIPTYPNPYDPANPLSNVYAWISRLELNIAAGVGRMTLDLNPNAAAWAAAPLGQVGISLGQVLTPGNPTANPPVAAESFPTLAELMADAEFASAYATIGQKLYAAALRHPSFSGATIV
jgi:hypothetical protein